MAQASEIETQVERRRGPRVPAKVRIHYGTVDALFSEFTSNVNEGGVFIETESPLDLEEVVVLQFSLPDRETPIQVRGRVVRVEEESEHSSSGMAIEFDRLDDMARTAINALVRELRSRPVASK